MLLLKAAKLAKGSPNSIETKVGKVSVEQLEDIAKVKMNDLNANTLDSAVSMIAGTARSMGIEVEGK